MFLAVIYVLTGTDVVLGLCWHCSGVTATVCMNTFGGCGESKCSFHQLFVIRGKKLQNPIPERPVHLCVGVSLLLCINIIYQNYVDLKGQKFDRITFKLSS